MTQTPAHSAGHAGDPRQELEVRLTAQRILAKHLHPGFEPATPVETFWEDIDLDLTGATLVHWNVRHCRVHDATFVGAQFSGRADFIKAQFTGYAQFSRARFTDTADFQRTQFARAQFSWAQFSDYVVFDGARFTSTTRFDEAEFAGDTWFGEAGASSEASFSDDSSFRAVVFAQDVPTAVERFWSPPRAGRAADPADLAVEPDGRSR